MPVRKSITFIEGNLWSINNSNEVWGDVEIVYVELVIIDPPWRAKLLEVVANDILDKVNAVSDFISISILAVVILVVPTVERNNILWLEVLPTLDTTVSSLLFTSLVIILYLTFASLTSKDIVNSKLEAPIVFNDKVVPVIGDVPVFILESGLDEVNPDNFLVNRYPSSSSLSLNSPFLLFIQKYKLLNVDESKKSLVNVIAGYWFSIASIIYGLLL
mgnify:CR=1 FL=1